MRPDPLGKLAEIRFPTQGYVENTAYVDQPRGSTTNALNVTPFDSDQDRARGGQRSGTSKYIADPVDTSHVQTIDRVVAYISSQAVIPDERLFYTDFTQPLPVNNDPIHDDVNWVEYWGAIPRNTAANNYANAYEAKVDPVSGGGADTERWTYEAIDDETVYATVNLDSDAGTANTDNIATNLIKAGDSSLWFNDTESRVIRTRIKTVDMADYIDPDYFNSLIHAGIFIRGEARNYDSGTNTDGRNYITIGWSGTDWGNGDPSTYTIDIRRHYQVGSTEATDEREVILARTVWGEDTDAAPTESPDADALWHDLEVRINKHYIEVWWDGIQQTFTNGVGANAALFTSVYYDLGGDGSDDEDYNITCGLHAMRRRNDAIEAGDWPAAYADDRDIYPKFDNFEILSATHPESLRSTQIVVTSNGNCYEGSREGLNQPLITPIGVSQGIGTVSAAVRTVDSVVAFQRVFFCDGLNYTYYDPITNTVQYWTGSQVYSGAAAGNSTLPGGDGAAAPGGAPRCQLIDLWRGRVVLAGLPSSPHTWYMSEIANPYRWNYGRANDPAQAASGTNSGLGDVGDVITAIIPFGEYLLFGCDRSVWVMTDNPLLPGAKLYAMTQDIGVVGSRAWAYGPNKSCFVFTTNGLYMIRPNQFSINEADRMSAGRLDKTFREIDFSTTQVMLNWDTEKFGLWITFTPNIEPTSQNLAATSYFWDMRTNSFWPVEFPYFQGPTATYTYDADDPTDRAILMGGWDSYIRYLDPSASTDDNGTLEPLGIASEVTIGPMLFGGADAEHKITRMRAVLGETSQDLCYEMMSGDTPELARTATPSFSGTWVAGRNAAENNRTRGYASYLRLYSTATMGTWSLEHITARVEAAGDARPR